MTGNSPFERSSNGLPDVRAGQVWEDNSKRARGRLVLVLRVHETGLDHGYVDVEVVRSREAASGPEDARTRGRRRQIRRDRFHPTSTGYRLTDLTSEDVS